MPAEPVIVVIATAGLEIGRRVAAALPGAELHAREGITRDADDVLVDVVEHLRALFRDRRPIIGICAAAILIRALAPLLRDKTDEPPVLAVAADGLSVVPLLGGHRGANALASRLAKSLGGHAAITTASESTGGVALDAPPPGWTIASGSDPKSVMARLRDGGRLVVDDRLCAARWLDGLRSSATTPVDVEVTHLRRFAAPVGLVPRVLALGVGCERGIPTAELDDFVARQVECLDIAPEAVAVVVSLDVKAGEPAIRALADRLDVPARFFDATTLEGETPRLANPSAVVYREVGCHGVAEAAALAAVGASGELLVPKIKDARATMAVARAAGPLRPERIGRPGGRLRLLSLGPGAREGRTRRVDRALRQVDHLVGFAGYLALVEEGVGGERHAFPLGAEVDRCRYALELAAAGSEVGLIGSGDVGVYAMASLVHEIAAATPAFQRVPIEVMAGVSAMHEAAARAGAPLGHDFCAISLSDLLTPWPVIERRLEAAAAGDFVVALYNPVSRARQEGFRRARAVMAAERPAATPCVVARQLGRPDERVETVTLGELDNARIDMLTLVIIGSSRTRSWVDAYGRTHIFTPRGYDPA